MEMMKAVQVAAKGEPMRLVEIPVPRPLIPVFPDMR